MAQFLPLFFVKRALNLLYAPAALCFSCASAAAFQIRAESREPQSIVVLQCPGAAERTRHHHEDSLAKPHTCCLLSACALPRSKPVSPQDPDAKLRSPNSFTAPDTPNRTRSLKFRAPVCRHHHPLQNPFASFIFFHPLVSTPWELSVHIMLRSFSFYLILHSHTIVKNSSSALVFVLMFIRTKADVELFRYQAIAGAPSKSTPCLLSTSTSEVRSWPHAHINLFWVQVSSSLACLMSESQAGHHMLYVAGA
jgi:hypothetical protein